MSSLAGKVAIVTGASKGIGAAIARAFSREGASVVVNYVSAEADAHRIIRELDSENRNNLAFRANVGVPDEVAALFAEVKQQFGKLDILVNNAGILSVGPIDYLQVEEYERIFSANVKGVLLSTRAAVPLFPESGGSIINIGSYVTSQTPPYTALYTATKGAVNALTSVLSNELGPRNIRVNAILPGLVDTEGFRTGPLDDALKQQIIGSTPLGRLGRPEDIADTAIFLASDAGKWLTGEFIHASGGLR